MVKRDILSTTAGHCVGLPDWEKETRTYYLTAATSVTDITTGHGHITTTPAPAVTANSNTPTLPPRGNFGKAFHAHDTCNTGYPDSGDLWLWY
ncbi:hypothetical protein ACE6H2_027103 [Prunus campanulata]